MFQRILVANDGSPSAFLALEKAISIAKKYKATLHMIVVEEFPVYGDGEAIMTVIHDQHEHCETIIKNSVQTAAKSKVQIEVHLIQGIPGTTITDFAKNFNFDLLVVGFMGHTAFYRWLVGSITDELVNWVPCSVLVVKRK